MRLSLSRDKESKGAFFNAESLDRDERGVFDVRGDTKLGRVTRAGLLILFGEWFSSDLSAFPDWEFDKLNLGELTLELLGSTDEASSCLDPRERSVFISRESARPLVEFDGESAFVGENSGDDTMRIHGDRSGLGLRFESAAFCLRVAPASA